MRRAHDMPFGAAPRGDGQFAFRLWAPGEPRVVLEVGEAIAPMARRDDGWHEIALAASPGARYRYRLADGVAVPDPASRCNPEDVHGASQLVDPREYLWRDSGWRGRPWEEAVIYELHVGTFTPQGTFAAAREHLAELAALGITALELMPLAEFPGARNWGYDGVLQYAPDASYGTPNELKALVDAAHGHGLMVLLDVVYNHFGPDGNYLHAYCPQFFNPRRRTPWGAAINFDGPDSRTVRDFYVHNALYWIEEYAFDGLRLDAVHAIRDDSDTHIVCEIAKALRAGPGRERHVHLVLENDANQARFLGPCATAQWNDDLHHAAHVLVTGETDGYYADYAEQPLERFGRALAEGFVFQGEPSALRGGARRGEPSAHLPSPAFVSFLQSHDQVGNRALGERLHALGDPARERAALACLLLSPQVPMLFMGEEFAAATPFLYFCDFGPELAQAVAQGRREEFARFAAFADPKARAAIPDPGSAETFARSKLDWPCRARTRHRERLALVRELLRLRRERLVPRLAGMRRGGRYAVRDGQLRVSWTLGDRSTLHLATDAGTGAGVAGASLPGSPLYEDGAVRFTLEAARD
jgi:maltooligosyltrehalose trehalohydrolase